MDKPKTLVFCWTVLTLSGPGLHGPGGGCVGGGRGECPRPIHGIEIKLDPANYYSCSRLLALNSSFGLITTRICSSRKAYSVELLWSASGMLRPIIA